MTEQPKVSIITPSYNQARFLEQTMRSVLEQDYPNLEYIVIDGGSRTAARKSSKIRRRLAYWQAKRTKGRPTRSTRVSRVLGEILAWLNSDDVLCGRGQRGCAPLNGTLKSAWFMATATGSQAK